MRRIIKTLVIVLTAFIVCLQATGCAHNISSMTKSMLKDKYGEKFDVVAVRKLRGDSYYTVYCKSKNNGTFFSADVLKAGGVMFDNYDEAMFCDDMVENVSPTLSEIADDFHIRMAVCGSLENYTDGSIESGLEQFRENPLMIMSVRVAINKDEHTETDIHKVYNSINKVLRTVGTDSVCIVSYVDSDTINNLRDMSSRNPDISFTFDDELKKGEHVVIFYENGVMDKTLADFIDTFK